MSNLGFHSLSSRFVLLFDGSLEYRYSYIDEHRNEALKLVSSYLSYSDLSYHLESNHTKAINAQVNNDGNITFLQFWLSSNEKFLDTIGSIFITNLKSIIIFFQENNQTSINYAISLSKSVKLYNIFHTHNQHTPRLYLIQLNNDTSPLRRSISDDISPSFQYYKYIYKEFYSDYTIFNDIITSMPLSKQNSASSSNDNRERDNYRIMMVVDDNSTTHCKICNKKFNILNRKHHCRLCNSIICGNCSTHKAILNRGIDDVDSDSKKPVRICDLCYSNLDIQQTY